MIKKWHVKILLIVAVFVGLYYLGKFGSEFNASQQRRVDSEIEKLLSIPGLTYLTRTRERSYEQFSGIYAIDIKNGIKLMDTIMLNQGYLPKSINSFYVSKHPDVSAKIIEQELYGYYGNNVFIDISDNKEFPVGSMRIRFRILRK